MALCALLTTHDEPKTQTLAIQLRWSNLRLFRGRKEPFRAAEMCDLTKSQKDTSCL